MVAAEGISVNERSLDLLRPSPPPTAPVLGDDSTTSDIIIEWSASEGLARIPGSPLFYVVEYSLNRSSGVITGSEIVCKKIVNMQPLIAHNRGRVPKKQGTLF